MDPQAIKTYAFGFPTLNLKAAVLRLSKESVNAHCKLAEKLAILNIDLI